MVATENLHLYNVSKHATQRYAERMAGKDNEVEINRYASMNEEKIKTDINKLICYGNLIYTGKQSHKDGKGNTIDVYLKDCWVILVDNKQRQVVTLYKIDLGLGDEFNNSYVTKMMEMLNEKKAKLEDVKVQVYSESNMYTDLMNDIEAQIKEYKGMIKNLEELSASYKTIIDNNIVKVSQANKEVAAVMNKLVNKKEF